MIDEKKAICLANRTLEELGYSTRELLGAEFRDDRVPEFDFLEAKEPRFIVRYRNLDVEPGCIEDDGDSLLCVEVEQATGRSKFLQPFG